MEIPSHIFREYDVRGIAGKDLNEEVVECVGKAFATLMRRKKPHNCVAIGHDGRLTSRRYAHAVMDGITSCGINAIDIGEAPTGMLYFALFTLPVDGGIMITGSHNPKEYNGLKIAVGKSTIHGGQIQKLREIAQRGEFPLAKRPTTITRMDLTSKYHGKIVRRVKLKRRLKVVVDAGNGVGGKVAVPLFEMMGCEVIPLYCEVDGNFPNHHPDPTLPETLQKLISTVKRQKADLGVAFDGDADRIGTVDEKGNIIAGDMLLLLFARAVLKDKPGAVVIGEVKCSRVLYDGVKKYGGKPVMWMAGHSLIKDAMKRFNSPLAGEMSGHIFFKHRWYGFDCAVYATARLLEIVASSPKPLSAHFKDLPKMYATDEIRIATTDKKKFSIVEKATKYFQGEGYDVNTIDGARIDCNVSAASGWSFNLELSDELQALAVMEDGTRVRSGLSPARATHAEVEDLIEQNVRSRAAPQSK